MATINSSNTYVTPYSTGEVNFPGQCSFMAYLSSTATDVTGDGTNYTILFDTELWDIGSNYNAASGIFTVPTTGLYLFVAGVTLGDLGAANTIVDTVFRNSAGTGYSAISDVTAVTARDVNNQLTTSTSVHYYLTAADTVKVTARAFSGAKIVDVIGGATVSTYFGGMLVE